jgi:XkdW protein
MSLYEKIIAIYPQLTEKDFWTVITLQNDSDGKGDYIAKWKHPTLAKPTAEQLA